MTQAEQLLVLLNRLRDGVCAVAVTNGTYRVADEPVYIGRAAARIYELRSEGYWIDTDRCRQHQHDPRANIALYTLREERT